MGIPIIGDIIDAVKDLASEVIVDKDKRDEINVRLQELADRANQRDHEQMLGQIDVNKTEAASTNWFVAGWRPAVGWIGATGLAYSFVMEPLISWVARVIFKYMGEFPALDTSSLMVLVTGMLGFGTLRTFERTKGIANSATGKVTEPVATDESENVPVSPPTRRRRFKL